MKEKKEGSKVGSGVVPPKKKNERSILVSIQFAHL